MNLLQSICKFEEPKNKLWENYEFIIDNKYKYKHEYYPGEKIEFCEYIMPYSIIYITNIKTNKKYFYRFNDFTRDKEEYDFTEELFTPLYISKYIFGQLDKYKINIIENSNESDDETDETVKINNELNITENKDNKEYIDIIYTEDIIDDYIDYSNIFINNKYYSAVEDEFYQNTTKMSFDNTIYLTITPNIPGLKDINMYLYNINTYIEFCKKL